MQRKMGNICMPIIVFTFDFGINILYRLFANRIRLNRIRYSQININDSSMDFFFFFKFKTVVVVIYNYNIHTDRI